MKTLVLIHTTRSTLNHHEEQIHEAIPGQLKIYNIYDLSLIHISEPTRRS